MNLIDPTVTFLDGDDTNPFIIRKSQEITQEFLDGTKASRDLSSTQPTGEFHRFASIPTGVVEKWRKEGFDILRHKYSAREIMQRLNGENLGAFITTNKVL